ncbi:unnamed protein product [Protopolystoma xenopodis]|uniref:Secreted protein n=1 Tax=Protopolystoma xenopodis TaxID=117903 RepID=A0A3S5CD06_9PLAT|nr:unnamed protein product [Protopolystoma xenopodis]
MPCLLSVCLCLRVSACLGFRGVRPGGVCQRAQRGRCVHTHVPIPAALRGSVPLADRLVRFPSGPEDHRHLCPVPRLHTLRGRARQQLHGQRTRPSGLVPTSCARGRDGPDRLVRVRAASRSHAAGLLVGRLHHAGPANVQLRSSCPAHGTASQTVCPFTVRQHNYGCTDLPSQPDRTDQRPPTKDYMADLVVCYRAIIAVLTI